MGDLFCENERPTGLTGPVSILRFASHRITAGKVICPFLRICKNVEMGDAPFNLRKPDLLDFTYHLNILGQKISEV
jgi:hypothetical protein